MRNVVLLVVVALVCLPGAFADLTTWTSHGPDGGEISAIAVDPTDPNTIYVGLGDTWCDNCGRRGGGIYKSTDGGTTWTAVLGTADQTSLRLRFAIRSLYIDSATAVYAVQDSLNTVKSSDGGSTWQEVTPLTYSPPRDVVASGGTVYVAMDAGIYKSVSGGTKVQVSTASANALAIDRGNPNHVLYGDESGIRVSTDGGSTWTPATGLATSEGYTPLQVKALYIDTNNDIYALARYDQKYYAFRSTTGGLSFTQVTGGFMYDVYWPHPQAITVVGGKIYAVTQEHGLVCATPSGNAATWSRVTSLPAGHIGSIARRDATTLIVGTRGTGIFISTDSGATWTASSTGLQGTQVYRVAIDPANSSTLYAGTNGGVFKSTDSGASWTPIRNGMSDDSGDVPPIYDIAADSAGGLIAGGRSRLFTSSDGGATWVNRTQPGTVFYDPGCTCGRWVHAVAIDPLNPARRYAASHSFARSTDGGATWTEASTMTGTHLAIAHANTATLPVLYLSSPSGMFKSTDEGSTWQPVAPSGFLHMYAATSQQNPSTVYAVSGDGLYRSDDAAGTWQLTSLKPPQYQYWTTNGITSPNAAVAPTNAAAAYAYANGSVYKTTDSGGTWTQSMPGLERWLSCKLMGQSYFCEDDMGAIASLAVAPDNQNAIFAGTMGHGVYSIGVTPPPAGPTNFIATTTFTRILFNMVSNVVMTWTPVNNASSYQIERASAGAPFASIGTSTSPTYTDGSVAADTAYLYRVRAIIGTASSLPSNVDLATTTVYDDEPLVAMTTTIKISHLTQLRSSVNAVRSVAGLQPQTFSYVPSKGPGGWGLTPPPSVTAIQVNELRTALDEALSSLNLQTVHGGSYTDTIASAVPIRAVHFQELRDRMK